ncbi:MAG: twin-arginine translocation pathway signal [Acidobacteria bacterium]|nr:twin-arginine translocation pathway signal [Acidobacteriota bacterium]
MRIARTNLLKSIPSLFAAIALLPLAAAQEINTEQILGGRPDSPVRIEVFSDFQCPACKNFYLDTVRQVLREYAAEDKVCVIYHEFPLKMHQFSRLAARYSLAAQRLGQRQWRAVMEALYSNQSQWSLDGSIDAVVAKVLDLEDLKKVRKLVEDATVNDSVNRDVTLGNQKEVNHTPTIFIYDGSKEQKVVGGLEYPLLKEYIDRIVK